MKRSALIMLAAVLAASVLQAQNVTHFPYQQGWENGLEGWTVIDGDGDGDNWQIVDFSEIPPILEQFGYTAYDGTHVMWSSSVSSDGESNPLTPSNWLVSPVLELSDDATLELSWYVKRFASAGSGDTYEVRLVAYPGDDIDTSEFDVQLFTESVTSDTYILHSLSLADYIGVPIRLAFHHYNSHGQGVIMLDALSITNNDLPRAGIDGPSSASVGDTLTLSAHQLGGNTTNASYTWIADEAEYLDIVNDSVCRVAWSSYGTYRIGAALSNSYGTDTAWLTVDVFDCSPVTEYPFRPQFEGPDANCWQTFDLDGDGESWLLNGDEAASSSYTLYGYLPVQDNWLVSRPLLLDPDSHYVVLWRAMPESWEAPDEHYSVWITNSPDRYADTSTYVQIFEETLSSPNDDAFRYALINGFEGDTVRIAFRHHGNTGAQEAMHLSNIEVSTAENPIVHLRLPSEWIIGDTLCFSLDTLSFTPINDIQWHILIDTFGAVYDESTLDPMCFAWEPETDEGDYWVSVEVSNDYGTSYDTAHIHLRGCSIIEEMPFTHQFGTDEECWRNDGWVTGSLQSIYGNDELVAYSLAVDDQGQSIPVDHSLATPYLQLPDDEPYELHFIASAAVFTDEHYAVYVRSENGVDTLLEEVLNGTVTHKIGLADYMGMAIQVGFRHYDTPSGYALMLTGLAVQPLTEPEVSIVAPALARTGEQVTVSAQVASAEELTYEWTLDGATPSTSNDPSTIAVWTDAGTYQIVLEAISPVFGSYFDTAYIEIIDCNEALTAPLSEHFDSDRSCWYSIDNDGDGHGWELLVASTTNPLDQGIVTQLPYGGSGDCMVSWSTLPTQSIMFYVLTHAGSPTNADNLLVSPIITLGNDDHYTFSFYALSFAAVVGSPALGIDNVEVLIGNAEASTADDFSTVLLPATPADGSGDQTFHVDLTDYRNQNIRLAIRHRANAQSALLIDEARITNSVGIDQAGDIAARVYPNPATSHLTVEANGLQRVELMDLQGRCVLTADHSGSLDISGLAEGVYIVRMTTDQGIGIRKIVKR